MLSFINRNDIMQSIALRGVPDDLHAWLKLQAELNSRSVNGQIVHLLGTARADEERLAARDARLSAFRARYLPDEPLNLDDAIQQIREDRDGR